MDLLWYVFEYIGTIAFAISGALIGVSRNMDIFGMVVLALVTAIGGGVIRDLLVGQIPPHALQTGTYVVLTILVTLVLFALYKTHYRRRRAGIWVRRSYLMADALGLASFTVTGASVGLANFSDYMILSIILGTVTAVGGGMIRDVLAQRIPSVPRRGLCLTCYCWCDSLLLLGSGRLFCLGCNHFLFDCFGYSSYGHLFPLAPAKGSLSVNRGS